MHVNGALQHRGEGTGAQCADLGIVVWTEFQSLAVMARHGDNHVIGNDVLERACAFLAQECKHSDVLRRVDCQQLRLTSAR